MRTKKKVFFSTSQALLKLSEGFLRHNNLYFSFQQLSDYAESQYWPSSRFENAMFVCCSPGRVHSYANNRRAF